MSGLDNILSRLDKECTGQCEAIIKEARVSADKTIAEAQAAAEKNVALMTADAHKEAELIISKAHSSAAADDRRTLLGAKVEIIEDMLSKALNKLHNLDEPSYFSVLAKLARKNALEGKGIMLLSERDLKRMPADFGNELDNMEISETPCDIKDGFILKYGDIEVNCSFSAILNAAKDELKACAGEILFG